jgi:hypothetical protein
VPRLGNQLVDRWHLCLRYLQFEMLRERNRPHRPSFNFVRTITLVRVVLGLSPGIGVRGSIRT